MDGGDDDLYARVAVVSTKIKPNRITAAKRNDMCVALHEAVVMNIVSDDVINRVDV